MTKGSHCSAEHRARISAQTKGKPRPHTAEWNAKIGAANCGRKVSPETREKIAAAQRGTRCHNWKGGRIICERGYVRKHCPDHPYANNMGYVFEHRLVMEAHLGRTLLPSEVVHHINGKTDDNRVENLMLFSTRGEHTRHHKKRVEIFA